MEYVIYRYAYGNLVAGVSVYVSTYKDKTGIAALRRYGESLTERYSISELPNYIQVISMRELAAMTRLGFNPTVRVDTAMSVQQALKHLKFDLITKTFG